MSKKKGTKLRTTGKYLGAGLGSALIASLGFLGFGDVGKESMQSDLDKIAELEDANSELALDVSTLKAELESHADIIEEAEGEEAMISLAEAEILDETRDMEDFLVSEFGWEIEDDDDIVISELGDVDTIESDYDEGNYVFKFHDVLVKYENEDNEYDERLDIFVRIVDGDVEQIIYTEA